MQYLQDNEYTNNAEALRQIQGLEAVGVHGAWIPIYNYTDAIGMTQTEKLALNQAVRGSYGDGKDAISAIEKTLS